MLKIGKGLKKKKKSKKNKHKEDELFTEEELEQYRKEHSQKVVEETGENSETQKPEGGSEELEKFKQLTAGVDDILKKSQGDLDRIKKESFFQRKPTPSELKAQEEKEKEALKQTEGNWIGFEDKDKLQVPEEEEEKEESESEYEFDDKDDIFDTTYVEAIESGEVKLVYVPEDDEILKAGEPDPFDTTSAEEVLKKVEEEEKKKKLQISLGSAVNVLTGRAERDKSILEETGAVELLDQVVTPNAKPRKRPRKIQDFVLIGSFDESNNIGPLPSEAPAAEVAKSLLDDDLNVEVPLPEGDTLITEVLAKQRVPQTEVPEEKTEQTDINSNLKELVSEFDIIKENVTPEVRKAEEVEDEFDEFTALAASSVANQKLEEELQKFEEAEDDPFDTSTANIVLKQEPADPFGNIDAKIPEPKASDLVSLNQKWSAFEPEKPEAETEVDPFDTTFAEKIQPGKCELKLLENEILGDIAESVPAHKSDDVHLEARILSRNNSDSDFNPREGEQLPKLPAPNFRSKVSIQITDPSGFVETQRGSESESRDGDFVSLSFQHRDLLGGSTTDLTKLGNDPLPPEVESPLEDFSKYSDPFDTSIVDQVALPGKAELKFIEKELLSDIPRVPDEDTLSDKDFDPRKEENVGQKVSFDIPSPIPGLSASRGEGIRPLTPYYTDVKDNESDTCEVDDPFDTSHVTSLPGKEELKLIEKELDSVQISESVFEPIHKKLGLSEDIEIKSTGLTHSLSDQDFNPREETDSNQAKLESLPGHRRYSDVSGLNRNPPSSLSFQPVKPDLLVVEEEHSVKALTPAVEEDISSYIDPFDTSIAENIVPGKAELKLLESELITNTEGGIKRSYTDPDFNPRDEITEAPVVGQPQADILNLSEDSAVSTKPLTPLDFESSVNDDIDPFDTSIATNLLPGKAEIRVLESELFGQ